MTEIGEKRPKNDIKALVDFIDLLDRFRNVERKIFLKDRAHRENDVEHSYQLAMTCWYLISADDLSLNKDLIIQYALVHDIVEVYAGDIWFYSDQTHIAREKKEREEEAATKIAAEYPEFGDLHSLIRRYEAQEDPESRFVYALDKLLPIINNYRADGKSWKEYKVDLSELLRRKREKIEKVPEILPYFEQIFEILKKEEKRLFGEMSNVSTEE